jgi:hypothetical protein
MPRTRTFSFRPFAPPNSYQLIFINRAVIDIKQFHANLKKSVLPVVKEIVEKTNTTTAADAEAYSRGLKRKSEAPEQLHANKKIKVFPFYLFINNIAELLTLCAPGRGNFVAFFVTFEGLSISFPPLLHLIFFKYDHHIFNFCDFNINIVL